ncbi:3',5'-cyclic-nucleotide phosphodiesterase [Noviherbaspirillum humi]|uniref:3',5'-cyclic-nucleotide phosphodiesterase n=1 Tax=Noviherbaspirillum humi TaxID=1688639 RepID=A0A239KY24_9BURK|nr:HD domain-containing phosphohydrolase [Noviherbaspirillum humi]SNT22154.1 3',5'-cyclic-nucleotide phosphodiesterase [Noviherbaspirillum humi]
MRNQIESSRQHGAVTGYLEITTEGAVKPMVFPIHDEAVIGRDPQDSLEADKVVCVPDHTVSRRHARIRRRDDRYYVEDLHSFNGTFVQGKRLRPGIWHPLRDGEEFSVASAQVIFHSLIAPAPESMPTIITRVVEASDVTRFAEPAPNASAADMQRIVQKLHAMAQVSIALGVVKDRATLTEKIMNFIFELFPLAERAFVVLRDSEGQPPVPVAARRRDGGIVDPQQVRLSRTLMHEVIDNKRSVLSVDTLSDRHFGSQHSIISQAIRSVMCVPLLLEEDCLGLIQVDTSSDPYAFKEQDLEMLTGVCAEAAVALKNFQLYHDIERLLDGFVRASVQAIEERDPVTAGHSFRVAAYAEHLAKAVDQADSPELRQVTFNVDQLREIRYAALLHDFGKVGVRENVLRKEKKLHPADMALLEQRFRYARACLERQGYRRLVELHSRHELGMAEFRDAKQAMEAGMRDEYQRLDRFLEAIRRANEPSVSYREGGTELKEILDYACFEDDEAILSLLYPAESDALRVPKGCLTQEERREIEAHVADSYSFLILIPWTRDLGAVPTIAHGHHEKLDGTGYPMGLRGAQISPQTRILTICDIFDALTAGDRPYKKAVPVEQALDLIAAECRANKLDTHLFRAFVESQAWSAT